MTPVVAGSTPDRILTAVRCLAPSGTERILEIGCGTGVAAEYLLSAYPGLTYIAVDRSQHAVRQTRRRNARFLPSGRLTVVCAELVKIAEQLEPAAQFDLAFAVNVNVFWTKRATREAEVLAHHLRPAGRVCLVYGLPEGRQRQHVGHQVLQSLDIRGLHATSSVHDGHTVVCARKEQR